MKKLIITTLSFLLTATKTPVLSKMPTEISKPETVNIEEVYNHAKVCYG